MREKMVPTWTCDECGNEHPYPCIDAAPPPAEPAPVAEGGQTNTREKGSQYGQGVPRGGLRENPDEVAQAQRPDPKPVVRGGEDASKSSPQAATPAPTADLCKRLHVLAEPSNTGRYQWHDRALGAMREAASALEAMQTAYMDGYESCKEEYRPMVIEAEDRATKAEARARELERERDEARSELEAVPTGGVQALGSRLADMLDSDNFNNIVPYLEGARIERDKLADANAKLRADAERLRRMLTEERNAVDRAWELLRRINSEVSIADGDLADAIAATKAEKPC